MAASYQDIRSLFDREGVNYLVDPRTNALILGNVGPSGHQYMVALHLTEDGAWLQLRTINYLSCPVRHSSCGPVLQLLAELNYYYRNIKYSWTSADGEIAVFTDLFLADTQPTVTQIFSLIGTFMRLLSEAQLRLQATIREGKDPGLDPQQAAQEELV